MDPERELTEIRAIRDPANKAQRAHELVTLIQEWINEASKVRREALDDLRSRDWKQKDIAALLQTSASRVGQLLTTGQQPERALLGTGPLTVAIGAKIEAGRDDNPSNMLSEQAVAAFDVIRELGVVYGLTATTEVVPPPGLFNLNRPNLVVLTSPRILPIVGQVLDADPHIGFANLRGQRWYIEDKTASTDYKSPRDDGEPADYAYIGRLPRPDGKGTFLYLAGIHAQGTLGAAHFLAHNMEQLYSEVKIKRWSTVIEARWDPTTGQITSTTRVAPIYRP